MRAHEIRIPEEFPSGEVSAVTFEDLLRRARRTTEYVEVQTMDHDRDVSIYTEGEKKGSLDNQLSMLYIVLLV